MGLWVSWVWIDWAGWVGLGLKFEGFFLEFMDL